MLLKPATSGGIVFRRTDLDNLEFKVNPHIARANYSTVLIKDGYQIRTVEHLLATLYIFGIDNLIIEMNGEEVPIMDGSAAPFVQAILKAGIKLLPSKKKAIRLTKPFIINENGNYIEFYPENEFKITYTIEFDHPFIQTQSLTFPINIKNFVTEIAPARTFGFLKDVKKLRAKGLALGGSLENALVLDDNSLINGSLRYPDEFVRHKILDLIGDLALLGHPLIGHFKAFRAGHSLHLKVVNFLINSQEFWKYEDNEIIYNFLKTLNNKNL